MNSDNVWPKGGELDILEYANDEQNKVTFHIDQACTLDSKQVDQCAPKDAGTLHSNACETNYFENKLGCMPKQKQLRGDYLANSPGIIAAEWASDHITVFYIPEAEIPADLRSDTPQPSTWGKWVIAYFPFQAGCKNMMGMQELVLNMQLCGDWAGATWKKHSCQAATGKWSGTCQVGLSQPSDCCTKWVTSDMAGYQLQSQYFDIQSLKVYTASGGISKKSGTFVRGGVPLTA